MADFNLTVSQLNEYVAGMMSMDPMLSNISVLGEVSGFKRHYSGHWYFALKDSGAIIRCVMFKQNSMGQSFIPEDGMQVIVTGYVSLYQKEGQYQLYARALEKQEGSGVLYEAFLELKRKLQEEGIFDTARKRKIPMLPKRVGIVTSRTGAALRDMLNIAKRRFEKSNIIIAPAKVQGVGAASEIAAGIRALSALDDVDVIIIGRGGGSIEELWAFNEEEVARAIYESSVPVISAVGHETDFTIADFAADLRAPTPSAAAELAFPVMEQIYESVHTLKRRSCGALEAMLSSMRLRLLKSEHSTGMSMPQRMLYDSRQTLCILQRDMRGAAAARIKDADTRISSLNPGLYALNPKAVLKRGYAMVRMGKGVVTSVKTLNSGDRVKIEFADGGVSARIAAKEDSEQIRW